MKIKRLVLLTVLLVACFATGTAYGAAGDNKTDWEISFIGTLPVPDQMEIIEIKDVLAEILKYGDKYAAKDKILSQDKLLSKDKILSKKEVSPEEIDKMFKAFNIGIYQFALKNNGTYNTALAFAGKLPRQLNVDGVKFFLKLKSTTALQEEEMQSTILQGLNLIYAKQPDFADMFQIEILEFYPFDRLSSEDAETISFGGSVAIRSFKLIYPAAVKIYLINKNGQMYVFGIFSSGLDRELWNDISKDMINGVQWNPPAATPVMSK